MKKRYLVASLLLCLVILFSLYSPRYIFHAPEMLVGFTAKIGCSLRYVADKKIDTTKKDIATYSPLFRLVKLKFDDNAQTLTASFLAKKITAQYRQGIGCTLNIGDTSHLDGLATGFNQYALTPAINYSSPLNTAIKILLDHDNKQTHDSRAIVVKQHGVIIAEAYQDGYDNHTRFLGWSMSKTFTGLMIGNLRYKNMLTLKPNAVFKEWQGDTRQSISLTSLLTMTSGLDFEEIYEPGTDATKMLFSDRQASNRPKQALLKHKPLSHWSYSSGTTNLLSELAFHSVGGTPDKFLQYVSDNLLKPMNLGSAVLEMDPSGIFVGSSFMFATARDWARLGEVYLGDGRVNGERIVTKQWLEKALTPNVSGNESRYGYQLWLNADQQGTNLRWPSAPPKTFAARGNKGQLIIGIPERQLVIVRLGWSKKAYSVDSLISTVLENL